MFADFQTVHGHDRDVVVVLLAPGRLFVDITFLDVKVHFASNGLELLFDNFAQVATRTRVKCHRWYRHSVRLSGFARFDFLPRGVDPLAHGPYSRACGDSAPSASAGSVSSQTLELGPVTGVLGSVPCRARGCNHTSNFWITLPATSVRRKSRPRNLNVSLV